MLKDEDHKKMLDSDLKCPLDYYLLSTEKTIENILLLLPRISLDTKCISINNNFKNNLSTKLIKETLYNFGIIDKNDIDVLDLITMKYDLSDQTSVNILSENLKILTENLANFFYFSINEEEYYIYIHRTETEIIDVKLYKIISFINERGGYNETYICQNMINNEQYLLRMSKKINKDSDVIDSYIENIKHVILYVLICSKQNIKFIPEPICMGLYNKSIIMIMEYGEIGFKKYIKDRKKDKKNIQKIFLSLYNDLYFLNNDLQINFKHNDLKIDNIVITASGTPLLIDFGFTQFKIKIKCEREYDFHSTYYQYNYDDWRRNVVHDMLQLQNSMLYILHPIELSNLFEFKIDIKPEILLNREFYMTKLHTIITVQDIYNLVKFNGTGWSIECVGISIDDDNIYLLNKYDRFKINTGNGKIIYDKNTDIEKLLLYWLYYININYITTCDIKHITITPIELANALELTESDFIIDTYKKKYLKYKYKYITSSHNLLENI